MTPRDNLLACINHKTPEWVPRGGSFTPAQVKRFKNFTGVTDKAGRGVHHLHPGDEADVNRGAV